METIRIGTFETNSSSTHSITMCSSSDFQKWKDGELYWDRYSEELVSKDEYNELYTRLKNDFDNENPGMAGMEGYNDALQEYINDDKQYYTYDEFEDYEFISYETYTNIYSNPNGEDVVAFGYYGYN